MPPYLGSGCQQTRCLEVSHRGNHAPPLWIVSTCRHGAKCPVVWRTCAHF